MKINPMCQHIKYNKFVARKVTCLFCLSKSCVHLRWILVDLAWILGGSWVDFVWILVDLGWILGGFSASLSSIFV